MQRASGYLALGLALVLPCRPACAFNPPVVGVVAYRLFLAHLPDGKPAGIDAVRAAAAALRAAHDLVRLDTAMRALGRPYTLRHTEPVRLYQSDVDAYRSEETVDYVRSVSERWDARGAFVAEPEPGRTGSATLLRLRGAVAETGDTVVVYTLRTSVLAHLDTVTTIGRLGIPVAVQQPTNLVSSQEGHMEIRPGETGVLVEPSNLGDGDIVNVYAISTSSIP